MIERYCQRDKQRERERERERERDRQTERERDRDRERERMRATETDRQTYTEIKCRYLWYGYCSKLFNRHYGGYRRVIDKYCVCV